MLSRVWWGWRWGCGWEHILPCTAPSLLLASPLITQHFTQPFRVAFVLFLPLKTFQGNAVLTRWLVLCSAQGGSRGGTRRHQNPEVTAPMGSTEQALCGFALPAPFILDLKHLLIIHSLTSPTQDAVSLYGSHMEQRDHSQYTLSIKNKSLQWHCHHSSWVGCLPACPHVGSWKLVCLVWQSTGYQASARGISARECVWTSNWASSWIYCPDFFFFPHWVVIKSVKCFLEHKKQIWVLMVPFLWRRIPGSH